MSEAPVRGRSGALRCCDVWEGGVASDVDVGVDVDVDVGVDVDVDVDVGVGVGVGVDVDVDVDVDVGVDLRRGSFHAPKLRAQDRFGDDPLESTGFTAHPARGAIPGSRWVGGIIFEDAHLERGVARPVQHARTPGEWGGGEGYVGRRRVDVFRVQG